MARIPDPVSKTRDPAIVVDLEWRDGLICFVVRNLSASSVQDVSIAFRRGIMRLGGQVDITALPIWDNLTFAPPAKRIEMARRDPTGPCCLSDLSRTQGPLSVRNPDWPR